MDTQWVKEMHRLLIAWRDADWPEEGALRTELADCVNSRPHPELMYNWPNDILKLATTGIETIRARRRKAEDAAKKANPRRKPKTRHCPSCTCKKEGKL